MVMSGSGKIEGLRRAKSQHKRRCPHCHSNKWDWLGAVPITAEELSRCLLVRYRCKKCCNEFLVNGRVKTSHRSGQLHRCLKGAWSDGRFEKEPACHGQSRMKPRLALFLLRRLCNFLGTLTSWAQRLLLTVLPCSSSICTAARGSSRLSSCKRWRSVARLPALSNKRCTVRVSTSQVSAVA